MIINGKIKLIEKSVKSGWYTVVLTKTRQGKVLEIPIFFGQKFWQSIETGLLKVGMRVDITIFLYGKKTGDWWNSYIVADHWRPYVKGADRFKEITNPKTGEIIKLKNQF